MADLLPPLEAFQGLGWRAATVTIPDGAPVQTTVYEDPRVASFPVGDGDMPVGELRRTLHLRRDQVPAVPTGTQVDVPGLGSFKVDALVSEDLQVVRVLVS